MSAQIRKLTATVGLPLFEQIGKQIYLTAAGHRMHAHCRKVFAALAELDVTLRVHNRRDLLERLAANEDDLYVFANPPDDRELVRQAIASHAFVVMARDDDALARRRGITLAELADAPFIVREQGSGTRMVVEQAFAAQGLAPRFRVEMTNDAAIPDDIRAGLGVGMLARASGADDGLVELDVEGFPLAQTLHFVYPVDRELAPAAEAFLAHARAAAEGSSDEAGADVRRPDLRAVGAPARPSASTP